MNQRFYQSLTWLMWLALPLTALRFWLVWDQLPLRMATHFNAQWQPNGWMSRESAVAFALGTTALMLVVFTAILVVIYRQKSINAFSWATLAFAYFMIAFLYIINGKVAGYNVRRESAAPDLWLMLLPLVVIAFTAIYLRVSRGQPLAAAATVAEEVHASPLFAVVLAAPATVILCSAILIPGPTARIATAMICAFLLIAALAAWNGFHYSFGPAGLEIRALGFRLRSIPATEIRSYDIEGWNVLRGYGIRGVGRSRAYVWGNKVVHVRTTQGDVYLGHTEPERIVRDLDMIRQLAH